MKSYTDLNQSRKLAEILPLESVDMFYSDIFIDEKHKYNPHHLETYGFKTFEDTKSKESKHLSFIPCWSLAALLKVISNIFKYHLDYNGILFILTIGDFEVSDKTIVDACYKMILKLHEQNLL